MTDSYEYAEGEKARAEAMGLLCIACKEPLVVPLIHGPCGLMCCRRCLGPSCPQCSSPGEWTFLAARVFNELLDGLKVHCPSCPATVRRVAFKDHVQTCPVRASPPTPFSSPRVAACARGCGQDVAPAQRLAHEAECGAVEVPCGAFGCNAHVTRRLRAEHRGNCQFVVVGPAFDLLQAETRECRLEVQVLHALLQEQREKHEAMERRLEAQEEQLMRLENHEEQLKALHEATRRRRTMPDPAALSSKDVLRERHSQQPGKQ